MRKQVATLSGSDTSATKGQSWEQLKQRLYVGQQLPGVVREVHPYGVVFDIGEDYPAFMDVIELPLRAFNVGEEVWLKIIQFTEWNKQVRVTTTSLLKPVDLGSAAAIEGEYLKLREIYDRMPADERRVFRNSVRDIAVATEHLGSSLQQFFRVKLEYVEEHFDETGGLLDSNYGEWHPKIALLAMDAWDRGEDFSPTSAMQLLGSKIPETNPTSE